MEEVKNLNNEVVTLKADDFEFVHANEKIHDQKFETKPVSFLKDSIRRFAKNKASIVGGIIIFIIILFSLFGPLAVPTSDAFKADFSSGNDPFFKNLLPKAFETGTGFWDGCKWDDIKETNYLFTKYTDSNHPKIVIDDDEPNVSFDEITKVETVSYRCYVDTYAVGVRTLRTLSEKDYQALVEYNESLAEDEKIMKPLIDTFGYMERYQTELAAEDKIANLGQAMTVISTQYNSNDSIYYEIVFVKNAIGSYNTNKVVPKLDAEGNPIPIYKTDSEGNLVYAENDAGIYTVRVDYLDYFKFKYGYEPMFYFGTNHQGQDLFLRTANGAGFSLLLGLCVTVINFIIGLIWGAIAGYYGGKVDLLMERFTDIISTIPSIVIMTLVSLNLKNNPSLGAAAPVIALLVGFVATGWIGTSATTRMQFYRYKGQEYVLASRTLGAKDRRLIFRHILPNAAGTLVTSTVLMIPSVIFSESTLTYLGIINLSLTNTTSLGTLLSEGQRVLMSEPYLIIFPAVVISLLMISFNLFGNGLRDAFNTTLRGED